MAGQLDLLGLGYSIDDEGDYVLTLEPKAGRTQNVYVRSHITQVESFWVRDIFSVAFEVDGPIHPDMAVALLRYNHTVKCGAWLWLPKHDDKTMVVFSSNISADAPAAVIGSVINYVALVADDLEEQLYGTDKF